MLGAVLAGGAELIALPLVLSDHAERVGVVSIAAGVTASIMCLSVFFLWRKQRHDSAALRESEARFGTLAEQSIAGTFIAQRGRLVYANQRCAEMLGIALPDLLGRRIMEVVPGASRQELERIGEELASGRVREVRCDHTTHRRDGSTAVLATVSALIEFDGRPAIVGTMFNLTEQDAAERALAETARDLERANQAGRIGSLVFEYETLTWSASAMGCELLGLDVPRVRPLADFFALVAPDDRERVQALIEGGRVSGTPAVIEFRLARQTGQQVRWIRAFTEGIPGHAGRPARRVAAFQDITAARSADARIGRLVNLREALAKVHVAAARETRLETLCDTACRIAVEHGGLLAARVRLHDAETGMLRPVADRGALRGRLPFQPLATGDPAALPAIAFREVRHLLINDIAGESIRQPERDLAALHGIGSSAVFPLVSDGVSIGTLAVFAANAGQFDTEFNDVLGDIAATLAFAHAKLSARSALSESTNRLAGIIEAAMDAIVTVDERLNVIVFNQAAERMFRLPAAAALGRPIDLLIPARFHDGHPAWMAAFAASGVTSRAMGKPGHISARRADGEEFSVEASISHSTAGGHAAYTVIMRDITERAAILHSLAEAEARYRSLAENSASGIALIDEENIEYANPALATMLGHAEAAALVGTSILAAIAPALRESAGANLRRLGERAGLSIALGTLQMQRVDGALIDVEASAASLEIAGRLRVQAEIRDVTRERDAQREIRALNQSLEARIADRTAELKRSNEALEAFSYSVAHDLRAPLRAMGGFAQLLAAEEADSNRDIIHRYTGRIIANADRMSSMVDGLLAVARASHVSLARNAVDFAVLVEAVLEEQQARTRAKVLLGPLPVVIGDMVALRQVWANLISNAIKYTSGVAEPEIRIDCRAAGPDTEFRVQDNGAGFDAAFAGSLFGVFRRLHPASQFEGTGIGLAIVRHVVERHGGRVWAEGQPQRGATFHFTLPASRVPQRPTAAT